MENTLYSSATHSPKKWVLDTNVVLDWLYFNDPRTRLFQAAIEGGQLTLLASQATLDELKRVLNYRQFKLTPAQQTALFVQYQEQVQLIDMPNMPSQPLPDCRDPDDQKFLELACAGAAHKLISKDKRLLELGRARVRQRYALGFAIQAPENLSADESA